MAKAVGSAGSSGSPVTVAVCALTFRRPRGLASLLESLAALDDPGPDYRVRIVIIDNDPEQSARQAVEGAATSMPWEIVYAAEDRRGIPFGRNRAVTMAGDADFVAFLDDDEIACREWLAELLRVQRSTAADVVTGTVLPAFETDPPTWMVEGGFFERRRYPTGHRLGYARTRTCSSLLRSSRRPGRRPSPKRSPSMEGTTPTSSCGRTIRVSRSSGPTTLWFMKRSHQLG